MYFPHNLVAQYSSYVYCIFMYLQCFDTAALQTVSASPNLSILAVYAYIQLHATTS